MTKRKSHSQTVPSNGFFQKLKNAFRKYTPLQSRNNGGPAFRKSWSGIAITGEIIKCGGFYFIFFGHDNRNEAIVDITSAASGQLVYNQNQFIFGEKNKLDIKTENKRITLVGHMGTADAVNVTITVEKFN